MIKHIYFLIHLARKKKTTRKMNCILQKIQSLDIDKYDIEILAQLRKWFQRYQILKVKKKKGEREQIYGWLKFCGIRDTIPHNFCDPTFIPNEVHLRFAVCQNETKRIEEGARKSIYLGKCATDLASWYLRFKYKTGFLSTLDKIIGIIILISLYKMYNETEVTKLLLSIQSSRRNQTSLRIL